MPQVSIVIPVYDEEDCARALVDALDRFLATFDREAEVILVDDGSGDRTPEILQRLVEHRPGYRMVVLRRNSGQTAAMAAGLEVAQGEIIVFMDADLQNDPEDIPSLLSKIDEGYDLVSGWRRDRKDRTFTRTLPSRAANIIIGAVTGVRLHDYGCTLKAYRAGVVKHLHLYSDMHRFLPALCSQSGARITEIVVRHYPRILGSSKYGLNRIFKVALDLIVIKMIVSFSDRPMHYFGRMSLVFLALSGIVAAFWASHQIHGWKEASIILPALLVLFFCCFLYFLFLGLLADLILRVGPRDPKDLAAAVAETL